MVRATLYQRCCTPLQVRKVTSGTIFHPGRLLFGCKRTLRNAGHYLKKKGKLKKVRLLVVIVKMKYMIFKHVYESHRTI